MELNPEIEPNKKSTGKLTLRSVILGIFTAVLTETLLMVIGMFVSKNAVEALPLTSSPLWWTATLLLSFFLGRYVTQKASGIPMKSIFRWEEKNEL